MRKLKNKISAAERWERNLYVNDEETADCLNCGRTKARQISIAAGARLKLGSRAVNEPAKIKQYLESLGA